MPLFLREDDVRGLLTMEDALEAVEEAFRLHGLGEADNRPRQRPRLPEAMLHVLAAGVPGAGLGLKAYTVGSGGVRFVVLLWDAQTGDLEALIEAGHMGQMRTGAASGVATKYLARPDARSVGILGTGTQAPAQLEAVCAVRPLDKILAYSPTPHHRRRFAAEMTERLGLTVEPVDAARDAVVDADIVITITKASTPVLHGDWLRPGAHVNAVGSNRSRAQEIDARTLERAALVTIDDLDQGRIEAGDLLAAERENVLSWDEVVELGHIVVGPHWGPPTMVGRHHPGRRDPESITVFESLGVAMQDIAVARIVYDKALDTGLGDPMPDTMLGK